MSQHKIKVANIPPAQQKMQEKIALSNRAQQITMQRVQYNPLPEGEKGLGVLRTIKECPVPPYTQELQELLSHVINDPTVDDAVADSLLQTSTSAFLSSRRECAKNIRTRDVCSFANDEELAALHAQLKEIDSEMDVLQAKMQSIMATAEKVLEQRWVSAVRKNGLLPEKYSYRINEERGIVESVDLDCAACKSRTVLKQAIAEANQVLARKMEVLNDDSRKD